MSTRLPPDPVLRREAASGMPAVLPVGAIEQHGAHLPVTTDSDIATAVAARLGRRIGARVFPAVSYGVSREHAPLFHASVGAGTLRAQLDQVCSSLLDAGFCHVFVINGHYSNQRSLGRSGRRVTKVSYWRYMSAPFDHAGLVETSLMLAVSDGVRMGLARKGLDPSEHTAAQLARISRLASRSFPAATGNGIWGDPRGATAAAGRRLLAEIVKNLEIECRSRLKRGGRK